MLRRLAAAALVLTALALTGCSQTVHVTPAEDANNPACAEVSVRLPDAIAGYNRSWTDAQSTGAWGNPSVAVLSCGVKVPGPTSTLQCSTIEGVDWLVDDSDERGVRVTTYGRDPAVQIFIDNHTVSSNEVLSNRGLVDAVKQISATRKCVSPDELPDDYVE